MAKYKIYKNRRIKYHPSIQIDEDLKNKTWTNFLLTHSPNRNTFVKLPSKLNKNDTKDNYISKKYYVEPLIYRGKEVRKYVLDEVNLKFLDDLVNKKSWRSANSTSLTKNVRSSPTKKIKSKKK